MLELSLAHLRVTQVKVEVQILSQSFVLTDNLLAHVGYVVLFSIVRNAVVESELNVCDKLVGFLVIILIQLLFNRTEVHWLCDDSWIVGDAKHVWVDWLVKKPTILVFPYRSH